MHLSRFIVSFFVAFCVLPTAVLPADYEPPPSVLEYVLGDNSNGQVSYGYWYAIWSPQFTYSEEQAGDIEIDPALLSQTSFSMNASGTTNIFVQYVADQFFDEFQTEADKRFTRDEQETAKEILARIKQKIPDTAFAIRGEATIGEFQAAARSTGDGITGGILGARRANEGTFYQPTDVLVWESSYSEYQLDLVIGGGGKVGRGTWGDGGISLGVRFLNYSRPIGYSYETLTNPDPNAFLINPRFNWVVLSDYQGTYANLGLYAEVQGEDGFAEMDYHFGLGGGEVSNDYIQTVDASAFYFDMSIKLGYEFLNLDYMGARIFFGYRLLMTTMDAGEIVDLDKEHTIKTKRQLNGIPSGTEGTYYLSSFDIFHGPIFGAQLRF